MKGLQRPVRVLVVDQMEEMVSTRNPFHLKFYSEAKSPASVYLPPRRCAPEYNGDRMKLITLKLTEDELKLLTTLAADQLFRKEFIDPRMVGYRYDSEELRLGKELIDRLRPLFDAGYALRKPSPRRSGATA